MDASKKKKKHLIENPTSVICFYEDDNGPLVAMFDNIREIIEYKGLTYSKQTYHRVFSSIYMALKRDGYTRLLGKKLYVCIVDLDFDDEDDEDIKK